MKIRNTEVKKSAVFDEVNLLKRSAIGDSDAFSKLYLHYYPKLFKFINGMLNSKEDSEEILHDIFLGIWEKKDHLPDINSFNSYLYKVAKYKLINLHAHRRVQQKAANYLKETVERTHGSADEDLILRQYENVFSEAINLLPIKRRQVFEMRNLQELSHDEIAAELKISKSMVKKQCYAASKHIKSYLFQNSGLITSYLLISLVTLFPLL